MLLIIDGGSYLSATYQLQRTCGTVAEFRNFLSFGQFLLRILKNVHLPFIYALVGQAYAGFANFNLMVQL